MKYPEQLLKCSLPCLIALLVLSQPAAAQGVQVREGLSYSFGVGYGWCRVGCQNCIGQRDGGPSLLAGIGVATSESLVIGLEATGWGRQDDEVRRVHGTASLQANWYPNPRGRMYLTFGGGATFYRASDGGSTALTSTSFGPRVGMGIDLPAGPNSTLTPFVRYSQTLYGNLRFGDGVAISDAGFSLVQVGLSVTWR